MQIDPCETKGRRNQRGSGFSVRAETFAVHQQLGIEVAWAPTIQHRPHSRDIDTEKVGDRLQVGGESHNRANVQIAIGPAVQTVANAGSERVINGGVTKST